METVIWIADQFYINIQLFIFLSHLYTKNEHGERRLT